jgi:hypothetical protein
VGLTLLDKLDNSPDYSNRWGIYSPSAHSRRTRSNAVFEKTNFMSEHAESSTQWRPITIEMKGENKLVVRSQGRYHIRVYEDKLKGTWYSPLRSQIGSDEEQFFYGTSTIGQRPNRGRWIV